MSTPTLTVRIAPLVPAVSLPQNASARTRPVIPAGYGVQEQCLPFTAASALGLLIPSPIRFGLCSPSNVPPGCRSFSAPIGTDTRVFYVQDNPSCRFAANAYSFEGVPTPGASVQEPGISFFHRDDQQDLFKLHLPYIWRTPDSIDTLFIPLMNRDSRGLHILSGLVETDWYTSPVNLVIRKPDGDLHLNAGDPVAQAIFIPRDARRPTLEIAADHARLARDARKGLAEWDQQHAADPAAYKKLARSRHGRVDPE